MKLIEVKPISEIISIWHEIITSTCTFTMYVVIYILYDIIIRTFTIDVVLPVTVRCADQKFWPKLNIDCSTWGMHSSTYTNGVLTRCTTQVYACFFRKPTIYNTFYTQDHFYIIYPIKQCHSTSLNWDLINTRLIIQLYVINYIWNISVLKECSFFNEI